MYGMLMIVSFAISYIALMVVMGLTADYLRQRGQERRSAATTEVQQPAQPICLEPDAPSATESEWDSTDRQPEHAAVA
jgi:hypothetical protein